MIKKKNTEPDDGLDDNIVYIGDMKDIYIGEISGCSSSRKKGDGYIEVVSTIDVDKCLAGKQPFNVRVPEYLGNYWDEVLKLPFLTPKERKVYKLRKYGKPPTKKDQNMYPLTLDEVGKTFRPRITKERVRQIEKRAQEKLEYHEYEVRKTIKEVCEKHDKAEREGDN